MTARRWMSFVLALLATASAARSAVAANARPNILFIFSDDIGIDGFGCYGSDRSKTFTPNIDKLAREGVRFDRCYSTPLCGPSRCVIMTGRYGFRTGGLTNETAGAPSYKDEPSLAKVLKSAGYATGMAGKWRQMSDTPADWGFDEYITDPTAGGWFWKKNYFKNGQEITTPEEVYYPDVCSDFAVDFITRHKDRPFYFYLPEHLIHGPILKTPDTKAGAAQSDLYDDDIKYLDKTVGKLVSTLDKLGLRENTVILFSADNGTSRIGYTPENDPNKITGKMGGRAVNGMKGQLLEGGCRVPLIANWKGTLPGGKTNKDLIDFSDLLPTFADLAGAKPPTGVKFDGVSFAPQLRGQTGSPREWIFVQLGAGWFVRNDGWKMNEKGELFSLKDAPFVEEPVPAGSTLPGADAARARLTQVLAELNPAGGKTLKPGQRPGPGNNPGAGNPRANRRRGAAKQAN